jgi:hypothetical protein
MSNSNIIFIIYFPFKNTLMSAIVKIGIFMGLAKASKRDSNYKYGP